MTFDRAVGKQVLLDLTNMLNNMGVPHFIIQGTALGAYRDRDFTPTEADVDIGILIEHLVPNVVELWNKLDAYCTKVRAFKQPFSQVRTLCGDMYGIHFDIVGVMKWNNERFVSSPRIPTVLEPYSIVHPAELLENTETIEMFGQEFQVPSPIETYLEREYGSTWRTPRKDHVSKTRIYNYCKDRNIPKDLLDEYSVLKS